MRGICFVLLLSVSPLVAQELPSPRSENRFRIEAGSGSYTGRIVYVDGDSLRLELEPNDSLYTFPRKSITRIELSLGKNPSGLKGAGIGFGIGAVFGFGLGYAIDPGEDVPRLQAAGTFAFLGGLAGAAFGAVQKLEAWQELSYEELLADRE
jgi:hypothetical protein